MVHPAAPEKKRLPVGLEKGDLPLGHLDPYLAGLQTGERSVQIERPDSHTAVRTSFHTETSAPRKP